MDGRVVLRDGRLTTLNEAAFRAELAEVMEEVERDHAAIARRAAFAIPVLLAANERLSRVNLGMRRLVGEA